MLVSVQWVLATMIHAYYNTSQHFLKRWNENRFPQTRKNLKTITNENKIISKGEEKKRFLQTFIGSRYLINIEEMDCPSLNRFK